ncbi:hypothetical protein GW951_01990 [Candidatus Wolfebacteria bacterium]|nr:hypothetical protein [Candidatus Wolfebacteria bacterium]
MNNKPDIPNNGKEVKKEKRFITRLIIVNILLILTIGFLIMVLFDLARYFENPPRSSGIFHISK